MSELTTRYVFALLCGLGMLAIGIGAVLEIARFRRNARAADSASSTGSSDGGAFAAVPGGNIISLRQFRFRLLSAVVWMIVLGALCYATTALWPDRSSPQALEQMRRFVTVVLAALSLLLVAVVLFIYDVIQLSRERRAQTARFYKGLADMARDEAAQLQKHRDAQPVAQDNATEHSRRVTLAGSESAMTAASNQEETSQQADKPSP